MRKDAEAQRLRCGRRGKAAQTSCGGGQLQQSCQAGARPCRMRQRSSGLGPRRRGRGRCQRGGRGQDLGRDRRGRSPRRSDPQCARRSSARTAAASASSHTPPRGADGLSSKSRRTGDHRRPLRCRRIGASPWRGSQARRAIFGSGPHRLPDGVHHAGASEVLWVRLRALVRRARDRDRGSWVCRRGRGRVAATRWRDRGPTPSSAT